MMKKYEMTVIVDESEKDWMQDFAYSEEPDFDAPAIFAGLIQEASFKEFNGFEAQQKIESKTDSNSEDINDREVSIHITTTPNDSQIHSTIIGTTGELADCFAAGIAGMMGQMSKKERMMFKSMLNASLGKILSDQEVSNNESSN